MRIDVPPAECELLIQGDILRHVFGDIHAIHAIPEVTLRDVTRQPAHQFDPGNRGPRLSPGRNRRAPGGCRRSWRSSETAADGRNARKSACRPGGTSMIRTPQGGFTRPFQRFRQARPVGRAGSIPPVSVPHGPHGGGTAPTTPSTNTCIRRSRSPPWLSFRAVATIER